MPVSPLQWINGWQISNLISSLLYHPELSTPAAAIQSFLCFRWCYRSLSENCSIPAFNHLFNPQFVYLVVISDLFQISSSLVFISLFAIFFVAVNDVEKCLFHNSVLQTVKGNDSKPTTRGKTIERSIEGILQCLEFIVHGNSQSLKHPCCCLYPTLSTP